MSTRGRFDMSLPDNQAKLDAVDEIVPPGVTIARNDEGYVPPALSDPFLRRRRTA